RPPATARAWTAATAGWTAAVAASAQDAGRHEAIAPASSGTPGHLHSEVFAEIHPAHVGVVHDLGGGSLPQDIAVADDVRVIADAQRFSHVVVGDQYTDAARLQEADDALDLDHGDRVYARERLIQQDEARLRRQRTRNLHPPALTARQGQRGRISQVIDPQVLQQDREALVDLGPFQGLALAVALQLQHGAHVFLDIQLAKDRCFLRQVRQSQAGAPVDRHVLHGLAIDRDLA